MDSAICSNTQTAILSVTVAVLFGWLYHKLKPSQTNLPPGSFGLPIVGKLIGWILNETKDGTPLVVNPSRSSRRRRHERPSYWYKLVKGAMLSFLKAESLQHYIGQMDDVVRTQLLSQIKDGDTIKAVTLMKKVTFNVTCQASHKYVFTADGDHLGSKQPPSIVKISGKNNIFELTGSRYKLVKGAMLSFLKAESLQHYIGQMDDVVRTQLLSQIKDGDTIKAVTLMKKVTFNVTCSLLFGLYDEPMKEALFEDFSQAFKGVWSVPVLNVWW
ncbi:hypothetical protein QJS10_CPB21g01613 [Acorus calamus]|uniref:Uncharacterized protein n=1 Tax=Acorus calamus TaxID=4465 RepID=A0AAV9C483_ACOCL|nr:hypothetical protein QJS10_CPB21g01613 [Acorus calamus]